MITKILIAWCLVAVTVTIHSVGLAIVFQLFTKLTTPKWRILTAAWRLSSLVWWLIVLHMVEITIWGLFYWRQGCFTSAEQAFYFAGVTYTTIGYGELLLPIKWRMLAPVEGLTGILLCGLSAAAFFAAVSNLHKLKNEVSNDS